MFKTISKNVSIYQSLTLGVLGLSAFFMTGCTIPFLSSGPQNLTLNYESLWEKPGTYEDVFASYRNNNPNITIDFQDKSASDISAYKADLLDRLKNNREVPDIVRLHVSWLPEFKDYLAPAPSDLFNKNMIASDYYPATSSLVVYNTQDGNSFIYGVPLYHDQLMLVYNKRDFEESGIRSAPVTWEQFFRSSMFLTKKDINGKIERSGAAYGDRNIEFYSDIFGYLLGNANIDFPNISANSTASIESVLRVLNRNTDWNPEFRNAGNAFASRNVSMIIVPSWRVNDILSANPGVELVVAPLPSARQDRPMNWPTYFVEAVPAKAKNTNESWKLIKHMSSEESLKDIYSKQVSTRRLPSLPALKNLATSIDLDPILKVVAVDALNSQNAVGSGFSFVMSDRSGNTGCIEEVKNAVSSSNASLFINSNERIIAACGLAQ